MVASITDTFDGYYARKYNEITKEGKFLDPLADKILVLSAFLSFAFLDLIAFWMVVLIILRDFFVTLLRIILERRGQSMVTSIIAKTKTTFQFVLIVFILIILSIEGFESSWALSFSGYLDKLNVVYNLTFFVSTFTFFTGAMYLYDNRSSIF